MRKCCFCGKAGHTINDCKRMQKANELEQRDRASRRQRAAEKHQAPHAACGTLRGADVNG